MANNIVLNAGSGGSTLATEQNGTSEQYQKIKITDGTGGAFTNMAAVTASGALKVDASGAAVPITDNGANLHVQGAGASGAAKAGNPVQVGGVFNTTQPTVTTGQGVELQATARGAAIVATGVDNFNINNVSGTVSLPTGAATAAKQPALGTAGSASADVITVQGIASMTALKVDGSAVTQPVSGTVTTSPPANASTNVAQINGVTPLMGNGVTGTGSQRVTIASDNTAFTVNAAQSGTWTVQPGNTANTTPWLTSNVPPSSGTQGWSFNYQSALSSTKAQIKGSAGTFGGYIMLTNPNTAETYVQVFNKASANVTVGTTAPDFVLRIPGLASASGTGIASNLELVNGLAMSTGITVAATTTATGSTAPANALTATFLFL